MLSKTKCELCRCSKSVEGRLPCDMYPMTMCYELVVMMLSKTMCNELVVMTMCNELIVMCIYVSRFDASHVICLCMLNIFALLQ